MLSAMGGLHTWPTLRVRWSTFDTWLFAVARHHKSALNHALRRSSVSWRKSSQPRPMHLHASTITIATGRELKATSGQNAVPGTLLRKAVGTTPHPSEPGRGR